MTVVTEFNDGRKYNFSVKIRTPDKTNKKYDVRNRNHLGKSKWNSVHGNSTQLVLRRCVSSKDSGKITHFASYLKEHPIFSPQGDRFLGEVNLHIPVYAFYMQRFWRLRAEIPANKIYQDHRFTVVSECKTDKGIKFQNSEEMIIPRQHRPSGAGTSSGTFIFE